MNPPSQPKPQPIEHSDRAPDYDQLLPRRPHSSTQEDDFESSLGKMPTECVHHTNLDEAPHEARRRADRQVHCNVDRLTTAEAHHALGASSTFSDVRISPGHGDGPLDVSRRSSYVSKGSGHSREHAASVCVPNPAYRTERGDDAASHASSSYRAARGDFAAPNASLSASWDGAGMTHHPDSGLERPQRVVERRAAPEIKVTPYVLGERGKEKSSAPLPKVSELCGAMEGRIVDSAGTSACHAEARAALPLHRVKSAPLQATRSSAPPPSSVAAGDSAGAIGTGPRILEHKVSLAHAADGLPACPPDFRSQPGIQQGQEGQDAGARRYLDLGDGAGLMREGQSGRRADMIRQRLRDKAGGGHEVKGRDSPGDSPGARNETRNETDGGGLAGCKHSENDARQFFNSPCDVLRGVGLPEVVSPQTSASPSW